ncbi:MAG TPA: paraquat-inducible protein A [Steroidobacteraceae bacterium]|nr:paraquat-inducible protein A [Steroidobacteraceae bacterium]
MATACPDCGALLSFPPLPRHCTAVCLRCRAPVESTRGRSADAALACAAATLLLLLPVDTLPLLQAELLGQSSARSLTSGVARLWHHDWIALAGLSAICVIVLPAMRLGLLVLVLGTLRLGRRPRWLGPAFRWAMRLEPWSMLDVFLLAVAVGYYYLTVVEHVDIRIELGGGLLLLAGMLTMMSRATLDERAVWRAIGPDTGAVPRDGAMGCRACGLIQPLTCEGATCPRCGQRNRLRKPNASASAAALVSAALILFFPANVYPMNISDLLGVHRTYTNFGYVRQLFHLGLWPLGLLTFWTSIITPALMIAAVAWCVLSVERRSGRRLVLKTQLLRMVTETGRWSETGPLSIVFFAPLMDFGRLGAESAGWGATAFIVMTLLLIAASVTFDRRLLWDA